MPRLLEILTLAAVLSGASAALAEDHCQTKDAPELAQCIADRCAGMSANRRARCERGCKGRSEARVKNCQADARHVTTQHKANGTPSRARRRHARAN